jgi:hypothetical protein
MPSALYRIRVPTIFGRAPAGLLLWSRVYDEWIHRQDMRRALGLPDEEVDLASPSEFLLTAIVSEVLPKLPDLGGDLVVSLEGAPIPEWRYDLAAQTGAATNGPSEAATARVAGPAAPFIMAAAGRDSFDELRADGAVKVEGNDELATRFLAHLRVV